MKNKIILFLLVFAFAFQLGAFASYDEVYKDIAGDSFGDYGKLNTGSTLLLEKYEFGSPDLYGYGFGINWSENPLKFVQFAPSVGRNIYGFRKAGTTNAMWYGHLDPIYRRLENPISLSEENGEYSFKITVADLLAGPERPGGYLRATHAQDVDFRFMLGTTGIYFGYKYNIVPQEDGTKKYYMYPQLKVENDSYDAVNDGVENDYYFSDIAAGAVFYTYELTISLKDGNDTIRLYRYRDGEERPTEPFIETEAELSGKDCGYIGIVASHRKDGTANRIKNVSVSWCMPSLVSEFEELISKMNDGSAAETDVIRAFELLSSVNPQDRESKIALVRQYAQDNGMPDAVKAKIINSSIPRDARIHCSAKEAELEYNYKIDNTDFTLEENGQKISATIVRKDERTVKISAEQPLKPHANYAIVPNGAYDYKGDEITDFLAFSTISVPMVNVENGHRYGQFTSLVWEEYPDTVTTALLNGEPITNNFLLEEQGEYTLELSSIYGDEVPDVYTVRFTVEEAVPPVASDVSIALKQPNDSVETGSVLTGRYKFHDENMGDTEQGSVYKWYRNNTIIDGADEIEYLLTEADENCDIYFEVTPVSNSVHNSVGKPVKSPAFTGAYAPAAKNVSIGTTVQPDDYITLTYDYEDKNGDAEDTPIIKWYSEDRVTKSVVDITDKAVADEKGNEKMRMLMDESTYEKNIYAAVTPKSTKKPYTGAETKSNVLIGPSAPEVSNVRIQGNAKAGNSLTGYYNFIDKNFDSEGLSVLEWINLSTGEILGTGAVLKLTNQMVGQGIIFRVMGVSSKKPYNSTVVSSEPVTVTSGGSSGGGSGGSSGGSKNGGIYAHNIPESPKNNTNDAQTSGFTDVKGHWAEKYITKLIEEKILFGKDDKTIAPDDAVTRSELIAMLTRALDIEPVAYKGGFNDITADDWFSGAVQAVLDMGVVSEADNFNPNNPVTREETAKIAAKICSLNKMETNAFADAAEISSWAVEYINAVYAEGLLVGDDKGRFMPKKSLSRAEAATLVYRIKYERGIR